MSNIDPITLATIWHSFQSTCREMRNVVERTAQSYLMAHLKDLSTGIWLPDGSTVAVPVGLPCQYMGTRFAIQAITKKFKGNINPGDIFLTNDPYEGHNIHLPDWGFFRPIFFEGELMFFAMVRGHQMDTGGSYPGGYFPNAYDIHAEGLRIPPLKVVDAGHERVDLLDLIWTNVRWSEAVKIDNYAMMATVKFAEERIVSLLQHFGKDTVKASVQQMIARSEKAVRAEIAAIPDGIYSGESATDDDGTELDKPVWVRLDVTVKGDELILDFSRSDVQTKGFINNVYAATYGTSITAVLIHFGATLADFHNEGSMRPITVIAPEGLVVSARYPATVGAAPVAVGTQILESVMEAMGKAMPLRSMAAWGKHRGCYTFATDTRSSKPYVRTTFDYDGSVGAVWGHDGATGPCVLPTMAQVTRGNVEEAEIRFPWRILKTEIIPDLMGAGRWRGGCGIEWRAINEGSSGRIATGSSDGDEMLGKGVGGGYPVPPSRTYIKRGDKTTRVKPHRMIDLMCGDIYIKLSSGGGGVGDPRDRPVDAVLKDVRNGVVSAAVAWAVYKVVIDPVTMTVEEHLTERLRAEPKSAQREIVIDEDKLTAEIAPAGVRAQEHSG